MSNWKQIFVIDRECYHERYAIMMDAAGDPSLNEMNQIARIASECAYETYYAKAATAAARGDWEPAKELCRRERDRFGHDLAIELMRSIQKDVKDKLAFGG